jgi:nicotinamide riboside kinase
LHAFLQQATKLATKLATHIERHSSHEILGREEDEKRSRDEEQLEESKYSHLLRGLLQCHKKVKSTAR